VGFVELCDLGELCVKRFVHAKLAKDAKVRGKKESGYTIRRLDWLIFVL
jgi:hypothetical protein